MTDTSKGSAEPLVYSIPVAAKMLGISRTHAFNLIHRGELPGVVQLGGRYVISKRSVERLLDGGLEIRRGDAP